MGRGSGSIAARGRPQPTRGGLTIQNICSIVAQGGDAILARCCPISVSALLLSSPSQSCSSPPCSLPPALVAQERVRRQAPRRSRWGLSRARTAVSGCAFPPTFRFSPAASRCSDSTSPTRAARSGATSALRRRRSLRSTAYSASAGRLLRRQRMERPGESARRVMRAPAR